MKGDKLTQFGLRKTRGIKSNIAGCEQKEFN